MIFDALPIFLFQSNDCSVTLSYSFHTFICRLIKHKVEILSLISNAFKFMSIYSLWSRQIWYWDWLWTFWNCNSRCEHHFDFKYIWIITLQFSLSKTLINFLILRSIQWLKTFEQRVGSSPVNQGELLKGVRPSLPLCRILMAIVLSSFKGPQLLNHFVKYCLMSLILILLLSFMKR